MRMIGSGFRIKQLAGVVGIAAALGFAASSAPAQTLQKVRDRGHVACGVSQGLLGFSSPDDKGAWSGFDVDLCRGLAAAIFNDASKVQFTPLSAADRFAPLQSSAIDVLARNSSWTIAREAELKLLFPAVTYYDGQGFMVRNAANVTSALELDGKKVCVQSGTTTDLNLADYFSQNGMKLEVVRLPTAAETLKAYDSGVCDVFTSDVSQLYAERLKLGKPNDHIVLPEIISKEPLGPVVRQGDDQWLNIVKWVHFAMLNAEELGVTSKTVGDALKSSKPDVKRLVGTEGNYGEQLGLTKDWAVRVVTLVGNYGEVYERNVGVGSKLGIPRGVNQLWNVGGIQYAPPIR